MTETTMNDSERLKRMLEQDIDWMWEEGFTVVQQNKKRYLKFDGDERRLTLFLLKWT